MGRDPAFEALWRQHLAREADEKLGIRTVRFDAMVVDRIEQGQREFGDAFLALDWDGPGNSREEAADIGVYSLLDTLGRRLRGEGGLAELNLAALHGAAAFHYATLSEERRHE
ncbi:MAG TPA: hypothetical protein VEW67_03940 [Thermoleophilaceae bacterium]|nr:hypothetical protein [Thermoleophilaceae bacterium]